MGYQPTQEQLKHDTIYNTYVHKGLPPTPIDMPSLAALVAAAHPAQTAYIYFVKSANHKRGHTFSASLIEHNRAVHRLRQFKMRQFIN